MEERYKFYRGVFFCIVAFMVLSVIMDITTKMDQVEQETPVNPGYYEVWSPASDFEVIFQE